VSASSGRGSLRFVRLTHIDEHEVAVDASVDGEQVSVSADDLARATGWVLKPEGLCRGEMCVPARGFSSDALELSAVAKALHRSVVVSVEGGVAAFAGDPMSMGMRASIDELELPDLDGNVVRMSDYAGRKRLLIAWASW
jgi:hypothetical protein